MTLRITSPAFVNNASIPREYTCQGADSSPPLAIHDAPAGTQSFALVVADPDAPDPAAPKMVWDHWVVWNIPPTTASIPPGTTPTGATVGRNSWSRNAWGGPCPPIGTHRYFFTLYALDTTLTLPSSADKHALLAAMEGHILAQAELIGTYRKS